MKRVVILIYSFFAYLFICAQSWDYEWEWITPQYSTMTVSQGAITKNGNIIVATKQGWLAESSDTCKTWNITYDVLRGGINDGEKIFDNCVPELLSFSKDSIHGIYYAIGKNESDSTNVLLYTSDEGHTWKQVLANMESENKVTNIVWKNENTFFATVYNSSLKELYLYSSKDAGCHWEKITDDISFLTTEPSIYMAFVNEQLGYLFTSGGYYVTYNGGVSWERIELKITPAHLYQFNNGYIILTVTNSINKTLSGCRIINMFDQTDGRFEYYEVPNRVCDLGNGSVWAFVSGGYNGSRYFSSSDSLKTWQTTNDFYPKEKSVLDEGLSKYIYGGNIETKGLFVKSKDDCFIMGKQSNGRLFHTKNGGKTWSYKDFNTTLYTMQIISDNVIYMSSADSLYVSQDGGEAWKGKKMNLSNVFGETSIQFFTEQFGYIYDEYHLYQTIDGGNTWNRVLITNDDFYDYGGTLNGCFANERLGLFRSEDSKTIFIGKVDTERSTMTYSVLTDNEIQGKYPQLTIDFYTDSGNWIIEDRKQGYIYVCDTMTLNFKLASLPPQDYNNGANKYSQTILDYKNGKILLPIISENNLYPVTSAMYSSDGGYNWEVVPFEMPNLLRIGKSNDANVVYACKIGYNLTICKGIHKVKTSDSSFEKQENGTIQCSISNADNQTYTAKIVVEQVNGTTIVVQDNVEIKSGEAFVITLPQNITANYVIKVIPEDEEVYETVQSQEFIVNGGGSAIDAVSSDDIQIRVVNGKIECDCEDYTIYNVAGQKVQNNASLPSGTYFVHYGTQVKKVVVQ